MIGNNGLRAYWKSSRHCGPSAWKRFHQVQLTSCVIDQLIRDLTGHFSDLLTHLTDIPSYDQPTVQPWFDGKLDLAPPVKDLSAQGFTLIGGRIDYFNNRAVAALVYQSANITSICLSGQGVRHLSDLVL